MKKLLSMVAALAAAMALTLTMSVPAHAAGAWWSPTACKNVTKAAARVCFNVLLTGTPGHYVSNYVNLCLTTMNGTGGAAALRGIKFNLAQWRGSGGNLVEQLYLLDPDGSASYISHDTCEVVPVGVSHGTNVKLRIDGIIDVAVFSDDTYTICEYVITGADC